VDPDLTPSLLIRPADADPQAHRLAFGQDQGRQHRQLLDALRTDLLGSLERQLQEGGAG